MYRRDKRKKGRDSCRVIKFFPPNQTTRMASQLPLSRPSQTLTWSFCPISSGDLLTACALPGGEGHGGGFIATIRMLHLHFHYHFPFIQFSLSPISDASSSTFWAKIAMGLVSPQSQCRTSKPTKMCDCRSACHACHRFQHLAPHEDASCLELLNLPADVDLRLWTAPAFSTGSNTAHLRRAHLPSRSAFIAST